MFLIMQITSYNINHYPYLNRNIAFKVTNMIFSAGIIAWFCSTLGNKCSNTEFFLVLISLYSVRIQENTEQKKFSYLDTFHPVSFLQVFFKFTKKVFKGNLIFCAVSYLCSSNTSPFQQSKLIKIFANILLVADTSRRLFVTFEGRIVIRICKSLEFQHERTNAYCEVFQWLL